MLLSAELLATMLSCPDPGQVENAIKKKGYTEKQDFFPGEKLGFICHPGYALVGEPVLRCLNDSQWSAEVPECHYLYSVANDTGAETLCSDPGKVENADIVWRPQMALFSCHNGYVRVGTSVLRCVAPGRWDGELPRCVRPRRRQGSVDTSSDAGTLSFSECFDPGELDNADRYTDGLPENTYFQTISYRCFPGYTAVGATIIKCLGNDRWSSDKPKCEKVQLNPQTSLTSDENDYEDDEDSDDDRVTYCVNPGKIENGHWTILSYYKGYGVQPIIDDDEFPERTRLKFFCDSGYSLVGIFPTMHCQHNGLWSRETPFCHLDCGHSTLHSLKRLHLGVHTEPGEWPWTVAISKISGGFTTLICGGSLLDNRTVLTAAHCLMNPDLENTADIRLYFGKYNRSDERDDGDVVTRTPSAFMIHPRYDNETKDNDIALIRVETPIHYTSRIKSVCLPTEKTSEQNLHPDRSGYVVGWGTTERNRESEELLMAKVPVVPAPECRSSLKKQNIRMVITSNMFCAGFAQGGVASCRGDSGGPLVFHDPGTDRHTVEGIVSFGRHRECGMPGRYTVYTQVSRYLHWIKKSIAAMADTESLWDRSTQTATSSATDLEWIPTKPTELSLQSTGQDWTETTATNTMPQGYPENIEPPMRPQIEDEWNLFDPGEALSTLAGKKKRLRCISRQGNPAARLQWTLDGKDISSLAKQTNTLDVDKTKTWKAVSVLDFVFEKRHNGNNIPCVALHEAYETRHRSIGLTLNVSYVPEIRMEGRPDKDVEEGSDVSVKCVADSNPKSTVIWKKNGSSSIYAIRERIQFKPVKRSDSGVYSCLAINTVGASRELKVNIDVKYPRLATPLLTTVKPMCRSGKRSCDNGDCIDEDLFCNQHTDCTDYSDEYQCSTFLPEAVDRDLDRAPSCDPSLCVLPDCFCSADGTDIPGKLKPDTVPQMITMTFDDAVNSNYIDVYERIFSKGRKNPNGCSAKATFFVSHKYTNYSAIQELHRKGHEMASHSITHSTTEKYWTDASVDTWTKEMAGVRIIMEHFGNITDHSIVGVRVPYLQVGGDNQFTMMEEQAFLYDSTLTAPLSNPPLWPYTLYFRMPHKCHNKGQNCPTRSQAVWEMVMNELDGRDDPDDEPAVCVMVDSCRNIISGEQFYNFLNNNFNRHYKTNRAPFGLYFHASWFRLNQDYLDALVQWMDEVLALNDVYFVTMTQALQWIEIPTDLSSIKDFGPWKEKCDVKGKPYCSLPNACPLTTKELPGEMIRLHTCTKCPQNYPWIEDPTGNYFDFKK